MQTPRQGVFKDRVSETASRRAGAVLPQAYSYWTGRDEKHSQVLNEALGLQTLRVVCSE